tara:strand:- start:329 stop:517 length:189 start_codon:yes stop_codon:yes gene_type:complete
MTPIQKIKYIKSRGFPLTFIANKTGIQYFKMYRAMRGGKGLDIKDDIKIQRVYDLVQAFENE